MQPLRAWAKAVHARADTISWRSTILPCPAPAFPPTSAVLSTPASTWLPPPASRSTSPPRTSPTPGRLHRPTPPFCPFLRLHRAPLHPLQSPYYRISPLLPSLL